MFASAACVAFAGGLIVAALNSFQWSEQALYPPGALAKIGELLSSLHTGGDLLCHHQKSPGDPRCCTFRISRPVLGWGPAWQTWLFLGAVIFQTSPKHHFFQLALLFSPFSLQTLFDVESCMEVVCLHLFLGKCYSAVWAIEKSVDIKFLLNLHKCLLHKCASTTKSWAFLLSLTPWSLWFQVQSQYAGFISASEFYDPEKWGEGILSIIGFCWNEC